MRKRRFRLRQRIMFFVERQLVKGAHYQLLSVAAFIGIISIVGGLLVMPSGEPTDGFGESVWWAFLRLSDPGYLGDDEGLWRRFVSTIITIAGYVVFLGSLVAIITSSLNRKIRHLEQGLTPVAVNNHIIILGWTNRTIHIAAEIFQSVGRLKHFLRRHSTRTLQLIILADDVTPDHLQELKDYPLIGKRAEEIILRSGLGIDPEHLRRVDSLNAAAIIIPSPAYVPNGLITPDIETIKTLLTINSECLKYNKKFPFVVAEIQDGSKVKAAQRAYSGQLDIVISNVIISRLMAQNVRHTGLSEVYSELLSRSVRNNLFVKDVSQATGKTIEEVKAGYEKAVIFGVVRSEQENFIPHLNVPPDYVVQDNDKMVFLARKHEDINALKPFRKAIVIENKGSLPIEQDTEVTKILILGYNHHVPSLIKEFNTYEDEKYEITIASLRPIDSRQKELSFLDNQLQRIEVRHIEADYVKEDDLRSVNPAAFDKILMMSSDRLVEEVEADARTIVGYVLLEEILEDTPKRPHILLELADPSNEGLIRRFDSEVIISPMILSHLLASIALRRELNSIYTELFTFGGAEIIFRDPKEYGYDEESIMFKDLEKTAAEYGETALGFYTAKNELRLNPGRHEIQQLEKGIRLVVLTTVY
ncbi:MAG: CASTOR/POLLUX-related putative ion channel [Candidatus Cyclobacteriaceae bacterium M2_1C_046]